MEEIRIENISPHPKNPRKDLGDLTELTNSIRTFGVLQNLTVVPDGKDKYKVICGHRRLAAAEAAGLETVPCIIANDMDEKTQVSIMLLENMQRSDLTLQEEAQGLQMMLDLGSSIKEIVKETGQSETKVRHRVKMNELDQDVLGEKMKGQVSINDLIKLEKIKDIDKRNELLEMVGTNNFDWEYRSAVDAQDREDTVRRIKKLKPDAEFADRYFWNGKRFRELKFGAPQQDVVDFMIELVDREEEFGKPALIITRGRTFSIFFEAESVDREEDPEKRRKREEKTARREKLTEMRDRILESWSGFMKGFCSKSDTHIKEYEFIILDTLIVAATDSFMDASMKEVADLIGEGHDDLETLQSRPWASLAAITYLGISPNQYSGTWSYRDLTYDEDEAQEFIETADYLKILGYKMSDEEEAFLDGQSDLYGTEEE